MTSNRSFLKLTFLIILYGCFSASGQIRLEDYPNEKKVVFGNSKLQMTLDYNSKCVVTEMKINDESVLDNQSGIFSEIRTSSSNFSTRNLDSLPKINVAADKVIVSNIHYGNDRIQVNEIWTFCITNEDIKLNIDRTVPNSFIAEEVAFPSVNFKDIKTWDGAFLDYGGLAWFYLFNEKLCTYGVHSQSSVFWNSANGNALKVAASVPGKEIVSKFTRSGDDLLVYNVLVSDREMRLRYDAGTKRRRFIRGKTDVWDSFEVPSGRYSESVSFLWLDYNKEYGRGEMAGIDGKQVSNLLNTIARIGVIDAKLFGGNSWHTPYGPICLHEQYIGLLGIAINDPNYLEGYKRCLDYYKDNAIQPDGRVLSRWAYTDEDAMAGTATALGFYEAQWGYLLDSNPDFVTNVSELYNQCGDLDWVRRHKASCENALEYMLKRDTNGNHLVEMKTNSHIEKKGSDWIDIIWASYENAFVNAKLYYALILWSDIEKQLGDQGRAGYYSEYASMLKTSFNKPTKNGGFWDEKNNWYVHWLDKDRSIHGNNLVIPVNFMAIAYGICDNEQRKIAILNQVEEQMRKEKLFAWPLCMYSYAPGEGNDWQFPFANYENGDIFLSWGALGVDAYASYKPELALKYVENILAQYQKDGLAFQRYGRQKQDGLGDDILSGNSLAIVGLYKSIYGINPMYNRMYLNPHLPEKLMGTTLKYAFRGNRLEITLDKGRYSIFNSQFKLSSTTDFGFNTRMNELEYYNKNNNTCSLEAKLINGRSLSLEIVKWKDNECIWNQTFPDSDGIVNYSVFQLKANKKYVITINGHMLKMLNSGRQGQITFDVNPKSSVSEIRIYLLNE